MAEILIYRIEFLQNNPYGTYVTGDVLEVKVETSEIVLNTQVNFPSTTGIHTYLNGVQVYSGTQIITAVSLISLEFSGPQICAFSTYLFKPSLYQQYPFATYYLIPDSVSCSILPVTCDLIVVGTPEVTPASDDVTSDGVITINATSTNAIEYNLGSDFLYGDGQISNTFTGLAYGFYRIYLRDSKNCSTNVYVEVPVTDTYGIHHYITYFDDIIGLETKVEILERGYSGSILEYKAGDEPVELQLRGEGQGKFETIIAGQINLTLISETNQQYIGLYTNDPDKYRIKYYKDTGTGFDLKFVGKLIPFVYQESYGATPYEISVTGTDGLPELKEYSFLNKDGIRFYGTMKLIKILSYCLSYTKLNLGIRVACNLYADGMVITAIADPLDQAYVDVECFYIQDKDAKLSGIISAILKPFGARLIQWDGYWNIVRVEELSASYDYREFDEFGDYVTNGTFNPVLDIDFPGGGNVNFTGIPNLELQNGFGKITVKYDLGLNKNILKNGDFQLVSRYESTSDSYVPALNKEGWTLVNAGYALQEGYELVDDDNVAYAFYNPDNTVQLIGTAYIISGAYNIKMGVGNSLKISLKSKVDAPNQFPPSYIKVRMEVKYGSLYLVNDGSWTSTQNDITFFASKLNEYETFEVIAYQPESGTPLAGMDLIVKIYHAHAYYTDYNSTATLKTLATLTIPDGFRITYKDPLATYVSGDYVYYYELQPNTEAESGLDILSPNDYGAGNGNRKWVLIDYLAINEPQANWAIDSIKLQFQYNGAEPIDEIVRTMTAESRNKLNNEDKLVIGSSAEFITTEGNIYFDYGRILYGESPRVNVIRTNVLSYDLVYTGWLRNAAGVAWNDWKRDSVNEDELLHNIWLKSNANQYKRSWMLLRCSVVSNSTIIGFLNSFKEINDSNRIYYPISITLSDKNNSASLELLELLGTDSGGGITPYSSGFTIGFGVDFN